MADIQTEIDKLINKVNNTPVPERIRDTRSMEPKPVCPRCMGLGFLRRDLPREDPEFGKLVPCNCSAEQIYGEHSGLTLNEIKGLSWDRVLDRGEVGKALRAVQEVVQRGYGWVYLWGGPGVAKSLLLKIAVAELIKQQKQAAYISMSALLDNLREGYDSEYPNIEAVSRLRRWTSVPVLAIDELDKVKDTEYVSERRMRLLDERYVAATRMKSITLFAANESPESFDGYLTDRIRDGRFQVIQLAEESLRGSLDWTFDL